MHKCAMATEYIHTQKIDDTCNRITVEAMIFITYLNVHPNGGCDIGIKVYQSANGRVHKITSNYTIKISTMNVQLSGPLDLNYHA